MFIIKSAAVKDEKVTTGLLKKFSLTNFRLRLSARMKMQITAKESRNQHSCSNARPLKPTSQKFTNGVLTLHQGHSALLSAESVGVTSSCLTLQVGDKASPSLPPSLPPASRHQTCDIILLIRKKIQRPRFPFSRRGMGGRARLIALPKTGKDICDQVVSRMHNQIP